MTTSKGTKPQEAQDLTWKTLAGKNHGRQPARTSLYRESGYNANGGGLQENKSISNGKP
jgi:hypothetical protein